MHYILTFFSSFHRSPEITITSFDRPNLYLEVKNKVKGIVENFIPFLAKEAYGRYTTDGPTIVYCPTKKRTEEVYQALAGLCFYLYLFFIFLCVSHFCVSYFEIVRYWGLKKKSDIFYHSACFSY